MNARKSTGPRTDEGKARSRANAIKHGLAGGVAVVEEIRADFGERKAEWQNEIQPKSAEGRFALDRAVAATFRIQECGDALNIAMTEGMTRACLVWDDDRKLDAEGRAARLGRKPELVACQLQTSRHGVELMLGRWGRLAEALEAGQGAWTPEEVSAALDLLGIAAYLREGRAPFDPIAAEADPRETRRGFVASEVARLQESLKALTRVDAMERDHAEAGASALGGKAAALILRYEREAWRCYETMLAIAKADALSTPSTPAVAEPEVPEESAEEEVAEVPLKTIIAHPPEPSAPTPPKGRKLNRRQRRAQAAGRR